MSFERKTVEPERSPIDSPCQNVEKGSSDDTLDSMPSWTEVRRGAQDEWIWYAEKDLVRGVLPSVPYETQGEERGVEASGRDQWPTV